MPLKLLMNFKRQHIAMKIPVLSPVPNATQQFSQAAIVIFKTPSMRLLQRQAKDTLSMKDIIVLNQETKTLLPFHPQT